MDEQRDDTAVAAPVDRSRPADARPDGLVARSGVRHARVTRGDVVWLVIGALAFAYPVWQAFAFTFANDDTGWQLVFATFGWTRWALLAVSALVPVGLLVGTWGVSRGRAWWQRALVLLAGLALVPVVVVSAQQAVMSVPAVNDLILGTLLEDVLVQQ